GMRSWSKWVSFSRRIKSFNRAGPRSPAFKEFWLSDTVTPWLVVSICPEESARTRLSEPPAALTPDSAASPYLAVWFFSEGVLATASRVADGDVAPGTGDKALSWPCSLGFVGL